MYFWLGAVRIDPAIQLPARSISSRLKTRMTRRLLFTLLMPGPIANGCIPLCPSRDRHPPAVSPALDYVIAHARAAVPSKRSDRMSVRLVNNNRVIIKLSQNMSPVPGPSPQLLLI